MGKSHWSRSWVLRRGASMLPLWLVCMGVVEGRVSVTTAENATYSFPDADAAFGGMIPPSGVRGKLALAHPLDACEPLDRYEGEDDVFVIIRRGNCNFDVKVLNAQDAGYSAAIVFNDQPNGELTTMASTSGGMGIEIPAVFVTNTAGLQLKSIMQQKGVLCTVTSTFENTVWSVMAVSFISLLAVCAIMATFFFVRRHSLRRGLIPTDEQTGMAAREVRALPTYTFKSGDGGNGTRETCAICLDDYEIGDQLRLLPCHHEFHVACIDQWLMTRRAFCPVCKQDAHESVRERAPATTPTLSTPLLTPVPPLPSEADPSQGDPEVPPPTQNDAAYLPPSPVAPAQSAAIDIPEDATEEEPANTEDVATPPRS